MVPQRFPKEPAARVSRARRPAAATVIIFFSSVPSFAEAPSGFNFCAAPARPVCIDAPEATDACEWEVQAFIKAVFKYRTCLDKESERAVRGANDALEAWKCRSGALQCR